MTKIYNSQMFTQDSVSIVVPTVVGDTLCKAFPADEDHFRIF